MLRGVVEGVDAAADFGQVLRHPGVQGVHVGFAVEAPADARLVGHHDHQPAGAVEGRHGLPGSGDPVEILPAGDITAVLVQHPVAVEEQRGPELNFGRTG